MKRSALNMVANALAATFRCKRAEGLLRCDGGVAWCIRRPSAVITTTAHATTQPVESGDSR